MVFENNEENEVKTGSTTAVGVVVCDLINW